MEEEIQNFIDVILDMDFADYKIDWCFTAVYYYLHNHHNNAVEIDERLKMKKELEHAIKIYPEISQVTWDVFIGQDGLFTPLKNSNRTRLNSSSPLPVTDLNGEPLRGADSNLHRYNAYNTIFYKALCKWKERKWFGMTTAMIKDAENMMISMQNT